MKRIRQYIGSVVAIAIYYVIHEGAHLICALSMGVFKKINFMQLGIQIDIFRENMSDSQLGWFCIVGAVATFVAAWVMVLLSKHLCMRFGSESKRHSPMLLTCCWYTSIVLLLLDPLYLSILYRFVGGGDMNGIKLLMPETVAAILFGTIFLAHAVVLCKVLLPRYKKAFNRF